MCWIMGDKGRGDDGAKLWLLAPALVDNKFTYPWLGRARSKVHDVKQLLCCEKLAKGFCGLSCADYRMDLSLEVLNPLHGTFITLR